MWNFRPQNLTIVRFRWASWFWEKNLTMQFFENENHKEVKVKIFNSQFNIGKIIKMKYK